uniref:Cyclin-dependent kinase 2-associated protein 1 n=1 Tax=Mesocestoides corti TaxID=53468 RepID=A0A0R3ULN0_MESCO
LAADIQFNTPIPVIPNQQPCVDGLTKYAHLLQVIDEMGRDIKPTYVNNKNAAERLKKNIHSARILVRDCVAELERVLKKELGSCPRTPYSTKFCEMY